MQLKEMPEDSLAKSMQNRTEVPPAFELYDLEKDPNETKNLFDDPEYAAVLERLIQKLDTWQARTADPFADEAYVKRFTEVYQKNYKIWDDLGRFRMKDNDALDFSEFIPEWDPTPYLGKQDL